MTISCGFFIETLEQIIPDDDFLRSVYLLVKVVLPSNELPLICKCTDIF